MGIGTNRFHDVPGASDEGLLVALAAAAGGLVVLRLVLEGALHAGLTTIPPDVAEFVSMMNFAAPASDWRVLAFVVAGAIVSTALLQPPAPRP